MRSVTLFLCLMLSVSPAWITGAHAQDSLTVERPWARASIGTSRPTAVYLTLINRGNQPESLDSLHTPIADRAEVHQTVNKDGIIRMVPVGELSLPAGERIEFAPGGLHIMLLDLRQTLESGVRFPLTLQFESGRKIEVVVPVSGPGARGPGR